MRFAVTALAGVLSLLVSSAAAARPPEDLLADRPLSSTHRALFSPSVYPDTPPSVPAAGPEPAEVEVSKMLQDYLMGEFPGDPARRSAALAVFDDPAAREKIPSPSLRAALATLSGTLAERAIDYVLREQTPEGKPKVTAVEFVDESQLSSANVIAQVQVSSASGQAHIRFNSRYRAESPFLLTRVMAHEALHQDASVDGYEEAIAHGLDVLVYLGQIARHPELASAGTALARWNNTRALMRLNSGLGSELGLYDSNGGAAIAPGSPTFAGTSWWQWTSSGEEAATPGSALLADYIAAIRGVDAPTCASTEFDKALLDCIDQAGRGGFSYEELAAAARALELDLDTDGDGVFDSADRCPSTASNGADGCAPRRPEHYPDRRQIVAALGSDLSEIGRALTKDSILPLLRYGGFDAWRLDALVRGRFRLELTAGAMRAGRHVDVVIARGSSRSAWPGRTWLEARVTRAGRAILRHAQRLRVRVLLSFTPRDGDTLERRRTVRLRRARGNRP